LALAAEASPIYTIYIPLPFLFSQSLAIDAYHATDPFPVNACAEVCDGRSVYDGIHAGLFPVDDLFDRTLRLASPQALTAAIHGFSIASS
jgi:hypothetical protein